MGFVIIGLFIFDISLMTQSNEYSYKKQYVENHLNDISVLILGHSHFEYAIDPSIIGDSCFNFAMSGRNYEYDKQLAKRYIPHMNNLKYVFLPYYYNQQYSSYRYKVMTRRANSSNDVDYTNSYRCMYFKYMGLKYDWTDIFRFSELCFSKFDYINRFGKDVKDNMPCDSLGYWKLPLKSRGKDWKEQKLPSRVNYDNPDANKAKAEFIQAYRTIAEVCLENGVELILITIPAYDSAKRFMTVQGFEDMRDVIKRISLPNVHYYNLISDTNYTEDDFWDATHLNEKGSIKLSKKIRYEILGRK